MLLPSENRFNLLSILDRFVVAVIGGNIADFADIAGSTGLT
jgi:hypothetical protein